MTALQQTLRRCAYEGIEFPCFDLRDEQGHDSVAHVAYRVNGADIEWTGRKLLKITCKAGLLNGLSNWPEDTFPGLHDRLEAALREKPQGTFLHPLYGAMLVQIDSWSRQFSPNLQSGCYLDIQFSERNASAFRPDASKQTSADPGTEMEARSSAADAAVASVSPSTDLATSAVVAEKLAYLEEEQRSAAEAYGTLDAVQDAVEIGLDGDDLEGIDGHDARAELRALSAATWRYAESYAGPRTNAQTYEVPTEQSLAEIAAAVYGDPERTDLLRSANVIPDESFVPAGTVLVVPDARA